MLKSKIAMILAAAMVLATLYGCSSGVSDSTHKAVKDRVTELEGEKTALQGTIDAIGAALGLPAGSTQADILAALGTATADQLADIRTQLELADDADSAAIVAAIMGLQVEPEPPAPPVFVDHSGLPDGVMQMAGSADIAAGGSATIGEVTYSCAAGGDDCTVMVNEDGAAVSTGGMVTAAASQAYHTRVAKVARIAAATKSAETKEKAIMTEGGQGPGQTPANVDAGLGGSDHVNADGTADNADDPYGLSIKRDRMATTIKITDLGMMDEDEDPQFMQAMDMMDGRTMHVRDNGKGVEEVVIVSTDIEAPTGVAFGKFELADGTTPQALNADAEGADATGDAAVAYNLGTGALASTDAAQKAILDNMKSTSFSAPGSGSTTVTHTFLPAADDGDPNTPGDQPREAAMVAGTYNGAMGTYTCSGTANCTVTVNNKGTLTAATDGWIFTPDEGATSDQPDYDYLHYGFWLMETTKDDAVTYNEVETFAGSSIAATTGGVADHEGTASYKGGAVGVYVHAMVNADGSRASATSGHFKADANLTASFGGDDVAASQADMLTGTIDKFVLSGGEANTWSVTLKGAIDTSTASVTAAAPGTAKGGGVGDGSFTAQFHGPNQDADTNNIPPHTVVGEFNSNFTNGSVAGAFGARHVED